MNKINSFFERNDGGHMGKFMFAIVFSALGAIMMNPGSAKAMTGVCADCHVMHASKLGVATNSGTALDYMLTDTCLGCHTGDNPATTNSAPLSGPFVYSNAPADISKSLAGGNFKFADGDERKGHNPEELTGGVDGTLTSPPGWKSGFDVNGQVGTITSNLSCAGTYGCHGEHGSTGVKGAHHANSTGALTNPTTVATSYRFLYGIKGYEADDYDYAPATLTNNYNVYFGTARLGVESTADKKPTSASDQSKTMSYFCAECHGVFHSGDASNEGISDSGDTFFTDPWIRHPVDISMPTDTQYVYANYSGVAPVATSADASLTNGTLTVTNASDRIVMCLSCHYAHAGPYDAALRWDPTGDAGCKVCHSNK